MEGTDVVLEEISEKLTDIREQLRKINADVLSVETILADIVADHNQEA